MPSPRQRIAGLGTSPDVAVAFFTGPLVESAPEIAAEIHRRLEPGVLVGASSVSVVAGRREIEETAALSIWAGNFDGAAPARFTAHRHGSQLRIEGPGREAMTSAHTLVLLPDPFTFPADRLVRQMAESHPDLTVIGGMASASARPGGNRLILDDKIFTTGAVGLLLSGPARVTTVVSQGCRPIGRPLVVTRAQGNVIQELAGRPAYRQLADVVADLSPEDRNLAGRGLHLGRVIDESKLDFDRGDFLIRGVIGADQEEGTLTVGDLVEVGTTVQFQVRDAIAANEDLEELMVGETADSALLFTCNGRGSRFFGVPDHDAALVSEALDGIPVGGMFCAGEIGPVGDQNFLHGYTASLALFHDA
jgi:small ligand-binding sensory domain FIST